MKPNFLFIGSGKSGSTSLYYMLKSHPQIYLPGIKETRFFCGDDLAPFSPRPVKSLEEYLKLLENSSGYKAVGELSPEYLGSSQAIVNIKKFSPNVKFLCILRNPYERALSLVRHFQRDEIITQIPQVSDLKSNPILYRTLIDEGLYWKHIKNYQDSFPSNQFFIASYQQFVANPSQLLSKIYEFLDCDPNYCPNINVRANVSGSYHNQFLGKIFTTVRSSRLKRAFQKYAPTPIRDVAANLFTQLVNKSLAPNEVNFDRYTIDFLSQQFDPDLKKLNQDFGVSL